MIDIFADVDDEAKAVGDWIAGGAVLLVHIVLKNPDDASDALAEALLLHCKEGLAKYKYPRWFQFVGDLPKTATGKIQRFKLRGG